MKNTETISNRIEKVKGEIAKLNNTLKTKYKRLQELESKLVTVCQHENVTREYEYQEGGYYDRSQTTYYMKCNDCGHTYGHRTETGSYS